MSVTFMEISYEWSVARGQWPVARARTARSAVCRPSALCDLRSALSRPLRLSAGQLYGRPNRICLRFRFSHFVTCLRIGDYPSACLDVHRAVLHQGRADVDARVEVARVRE